MKDETRQHLALGLTSIRHNHHQTVASNVIQLTLKFVNVCFIEEPETQRWILIDTALSRQEKKIIDCARYLFGNRAPEAIILTHGHFDHIGSALPLSHHWQVPLYASDLELPYLTGSRAYPPANAEAGGGTISRLSPLFSRGPYNFNGVLSPLPEDGTVPGLATWRWLQTPGHTPGHISLFREYDRSLIAGDAFVSVQQESLRRVFLQRPQLSGPPRYFTQDWEHAFESIKKLAMLSPSVAATGHGPPIGGPGLTDGLKSMLAHFYSSNTPYAP
ncbi:MBL fold metallo-hydrolase [Chromohalobacter canadensis]|uniref:MBL fold metallo-hydrolase n=1 Tax=Chromohalobacter canadensis TaxID=141389 RepID=UPI0024109441|nr:MBL fold metallo-hydrolase [Chromohalobacter canadensis]